VLGGLLIALLLLLSSFSSALATPTTPAELKEDVARAGVSVVRLLVTYTSTAQQFIQCTGLGVLVASGTPQNGNEQQNWVLTDGSLVNANGKVTCSSAKEEEQPEASLSKIEIVMSSAYNSGDDPISFSLITPTVDFKKLIRCNTASCQAGLALFPFTSDATPPLPFIDRAEAQSIPATFLILTKDTQSTSLPPPAISDAQKIVQHGEEALQFITPNRVADSITVEAGMPQVDKEGQLTGIRVAGPPQVLGVQAIESFLNGQQELKALSANAVHDDWNKGITSYYQTKDYKAAQEAFQRVVQKNAQFQGAKAFEQRAKAANDPQGGNTSNATNPPAESSQPEALLGGVPIWLWSVVGLILLVAILLLVSLALGRQRQRQRNLKEDLAEAERTAEIDAQRIAQMEALQKQETIPMQQEMVPPVTLATANTLPPQELPCPRCRKAVARDAYYCMHCQLPLSPSVSGLHLRTVSQQPTAVQPIGSINEQPTLVPIKPLSEQPTIEFVQNGRIDTEKTEPYVGSRLARSNVGLVVAAKSDPGIKRKHKPNEDSLLAAQGAQTFNALPLQLGLFVVADGMGGHANGQDASRRAIQTLVDFMLPRLMKGKELHDEMLSRLLTEGVQHANQAVHQSNMEQHADMGTTITAALIVNATAHISNVGDSRTYLYRARGSLQKVTNDHSVVASLVEAGIIKPDDIYTHPRRNQIYRSLGEKPMVEVDSFVVHLQPGDKLLLCSDGLWDMVRDPQIEEVIKSSSADPRTTTEGLIKAALDHGGEDNVSVIVVSVTETVQQDMKPGFQLIAKPDGVQMPQL
jgi:serine/threonine protein phosphatase PrpC